jgi:hypothetical protein
MLKKVIGIIGIIICIGFIFGILFAWDVFKEINKYKLVITPGNPSTVDVEPSPPATTTNEQSESKSGIMGKITIGPTCPVMRAPPLPNCADKPYSAVIDVLDKTGKIIKTFSSKADGTFKTDVPPGAYTLSHSYKAVMPTFYPVEVVVTADKYTEINLQFDSGIR